MTVLLMVRPDESVDDAMEAAKGLIGHLRTRIGSAPGDLVAVWRREGLSEGFPDDPSDPTFHVGRTMSLSHRWSLVWFDGPALTGKSIPERRELVLQRLVAPEAAGASPDVHPLVDVSEGSPDAVAADLAERYGSRVGHGIPAPRRQAMSA